MSQPVPGHIVKTPFHRRGKHWKTCKVKTAPNGKKTGLHTGVDIPAPLGTPVVAARAGVTKHVDFGPRSGPDSSRCSATTALRTSTPTCPNETPGGRKVKAGDKIGEVGNSSSFKIGFHLHFERHKKHAANWGCGIIVNPEASLRAGESTTGAVSRFSRRVLLSELRFGTKSSNSVRRLQRAMNKHREPEDPKVSPTGNYLVDTDAAVRRCQERHNFGTDAVKKSFVGPLQAAHVFGNTKNIVDDL